VIPEPAGGAHRNPEAAINSVGDVIERALNDMASMGGEQIRKQRREKFLGMGRNLS
jgi:acetyl-CoA carboxylase carboxyl transferase subunit alpha